MISLQDNAWIDEAAEKIVKKMDLVSERSRNKIPYTAKNGVHDDRSREDQTFSADDGLNWWCNGFWAGMLWQMYHAAGNEKYAEIARVSAIITGCIMTSASCSCRAQWRITV